MGYSLSLNKTGRKLVVVDYISTYYSGEIYKINIYDITNDAISLDISINGDFNNGSPLGTLSINTVSFNGEGTKFAIVETDNTKGVLIYNTLLSSFESPFIYPTTPTSINNLFSLQFSHNSDKIIYCVDTVTPNQIYAIISDTSNTLIGNPIEIESSYPNISKGYVPLSINFDGNIVAISHNETTVKVYTYNDPSWVQLGQDISDNGATEFGFSISLDASGTKLAIGSPSNNLVNVYEYSISSWTQFGQTIYGPSNGNSGFSVSLDASGAKLAIGCPSNNLVEVYEYSDPSWTLLGNTIHGPTNSDFGHIVDLNNTGNILAIGAPIYDNSNGYFAVYRHEELI